MSGILNTHALSPDEQRKLLGLQQPRGPIFLDTGNCRCALQEYQGAKNAWRCIGNRTDDIYAGSTGKWFYIKGGDKDAGFPAERLPIQSDQYPPDNSTAQWGTGETSAITLQKWDGSNNSTVNIYDQACSGSNDTQLTTFLLYNPLNDINRGDPPGSATGCLVPNNPWPISNDSYWEAHGCAPGFYCPKNSINAQPRYCTPLQECQQARLAGGQCGSYPSMGWFEPILCEQGHYCPTSKQQLICPAGSYCPPGSMQPKPCTGGAICPEGSYYNQPIVPLVLLLLWNIALIISYVVFRALRAKKMHRNSHHMSMVAYLRKANPTSYLQPAAGRRRADRRASFASAVSDVSEDGIELEANITSVKGADAGFMADTEYYSGGAGPAGDGDAVHGELEQFVASLSRCIQGSSFGLSFSFKNLVYQPKKIPKPILSDVTGSIKAGTLVGVMGGSGAGKSTFVNVLMGKRPTTSGETKVNGVAGQIKTYKKIIGYVPQDDILLAELTVRENILHSARIRLPSTWSDSDIQRHVDILLRCLKLDHVKDNIVGTVGKPGVSGGQRKRVSIGMELAAAPMALFLDEPTSGLDATAASSIMELLKALSRLGITIVTIIHQPRQEIYESLDDLILLGKGRMLYCGATPSCLPYFEGCGFKFPRNQNPADVLMDIINGEGRHYKRVGETSIDALIEHWHNHSEGQPVLPTIVPPPDEVAALHRSITKRGAPWPKQIWLCFARAMLQQYRAASSFWFEMGVATLAGLLIGLAQNSQHGLNYRGLYYDKYSILSSSADTNSIGQQALLCVISIGLVSASPGVKVFGEEKLMFYREAAAGHNRFAYYTGKVVSTIPRIILAAVHFTTLFQLLCTPQMDWLSQYVVVLLYFYCIYGLAGCVSMVTRREDGPLLAVMASLIVGTLSGMAPTLHDVKTWHLEWLWRASPGTWASEAIFDKNVGVWSEIYNVQQSADYVGYNLGSFSIDCIVLLAIGTIYRVLAFAEMRLFNRERQR